MTEVRLIAEAADAGAARGPRATRLWREALTIPITMAVWGAARREGKRGAPTTRDVKHWPAHRRMR